MKTSLTGIVFFFAERFKHLGKIREKVKAALIPCYMFPYLLPNKWRANRG